MRSQSSPYVVNIDHGDALHLVKKGASLLLLDFPQSSHFGFDLQILGVGPNFKGVKMIPPGPHFVYYSATSKHGNESSPFTGFFINPTAGEVIVRRWDAKAERLVKLTDNSEEECYQVAVRNLEFDRHLGAYDIHHYQAWKQLTSYITSMIIERCEPIGGDISVIAEAEFAEKQLQTAAERRLLDHLQKPREPHTEKFSPSATRDLSVQPHSGRCFYTHLPHLVKCPGATGAELTTLNLDKSSVLETVLKQQYGKSEDLLLGELQFSFVAFLMGQSLESFSQWKAIVSLMLSCEDAPLYSRTEFFIKFLEVVYLQLKTGLKTSSATTAEPEKQSSMFLDNIWFSDDNFLLLLFKEFFLAVKDAQPIDGELLQQARRLKRLLELAFGSLVDIQGDAYNKETDEYAPVVVPELDLVKQD